MKQDDDIDTELSVTELLDLIGRNADKDNENCVDLPLADVLQGPDHVAWKLIQDLNTDYTNKFEFNDEQILGLHCRSGHGYKLGDVV